MEKIHPEAIQQWLTNPVTKAYLECQAQYGNALEAEFEQSGLVHPTNDEIIRSIFRHQGRRDVFAALSSPVELFRSFDLIDEQANG